MSGISRYVGVDIAVDSLRHFVDERYVVGVILYDWKYVKYVELFNVVFLSNLTFFLLSFTLLCTLQTSDAFSEGAGEEEGYSSY